MDELRRVRAKIPAAVDFETKPQLAGGLVEQAANWRIPPAPILADQAYGDDAGFRTRLHGLELEYVLSVGVQTSVYPSGTSFAVPERDGTSGRPRAVARADREPESVRALAKRLPARTWKTLPCRATPAGGEVESRFAFVLVVAAHPVRRDHRPPREEWLIIEWPPNQDAPTDYWLSNLPAKALASGSPASPGCAGRSSSTTGSSRASSGSTTTKAAATSASITTARSSPARTPSSPSSGSTQKRSGRADTAADGAAPAARPALLERPLPHLQPAVDLDQLTLFHRGSNKVLLGQRRARAAGRLCRRSVSGPCGAPLRDTPSPVLRPCSM
jgi:DDE superfamily endonuclease